MTATTVQEVQQQVLQWIEQVINTDGGETLPIVTTQNGEIPTVADPAAPYIVLDAYPTRTRLGRAQESAVDALGNQTLVNDYEDTWTLSEVNGHGDRLRSLVESQDRQDIIERFAVANLAHRGQGSEITETSEQIGGQWRPKHTVAIRIGLVSVVTYQPGYIETVQYQGTIGGKAI